MIKLAKKNQYQMWKKKKIEQLVKKAREESVLKNGGRMLKKCIEIFNGKRNPIRNFSEEEILRITNYYDTRKLVHNEFWSSMYEGTHDSRSVLVKKFDNYDLHDYCEGLDIVELVSNEMAIASNMSSHSNFLKLLGCCVETEIPVLVYEFGVNLSMEIINSLPWETKLRIANEIANAGAYLHYGTSRVIIYRDIRIDNIYLNHDHIAKLSGFQLSVPIPLGKTHVEERHISGTWGYIAPEAYWIKPLNEKSDVYNFGILLMIFFTGKTPVDWHAQIRNEMGDIRPDIFRVLPLHLKNSVLKEENRRHVIKFGELALKCIEPYPDARPTMVEIAQALRSIRNTL